MGRVQQGAGRAGRGEGNEPQAEGDPGAGCAIIDQGLSNVGRAGCYLHRQPQRQQGKNRVQAPSGEPSQEQEEVD